MTLRSVLQYLGVNSGDMQKGVMRIEPNVSVRPAGSTEFGTRTEIKNLNSFRALERSVEFEIKRQVEVIIKGGSVIQETRGWDDSREVTFSQRTKEEAEDYRYFPEPDLPPLVVDAQWVAALSENLPELPLARQKRFQADYGLGAYDAGVLVVEKPVADYFEAVLIESAVAPKTAANWISGDLFSLINEAGISIAEVKVTPQALAQLLVMVSSGEINQTTAKSVLAEMFASGEPPEVIVSRKGLRQISDQGEIASMVAKVLADNPEQVASYLGGKETVSRWLFGQVMRLAAGKANPAVVQAELDRRLLDLKANI